MTPGFLYHATRVPHPCFEAHGMNTHTIRVSVSIRTAMDTLKNPE